MPIWSSTIAIDDAFTHTWQALRAESIDNILDSVVVTALLRDLGCFKPQVGGDWIKRVIRYGEKTAVAITKGSILPDGENDIETSAWWTWRYIAAHIQRSLLDDQKNSGEARIKELVKTKTQAAIDSCEQLIEDRFLAAHVSDDTAGGTSIQSLRDLLPANATAATLETDRAAGKYGSIARPTTYSSTTAGTVSTATVGNTWWGPKYIKWTTPLAINLVDEMKKLYNSVHNNQEPPDAILCAQGIFETFETSAMDQSMIVRDEGTKIANLGFEVLRFKGKPMVWSSNMPVDNMMFLTSKYLEVIYDPNLWFDMTDWKPIPKQTERLAHIISAMNVVATQPRRFGLGYV